MFLHVLDNWDTLAKFNASSKPTLTTSIVRSRRTGLTVVLSRTDSPTVSGVFCLATEAQDNRGLPHTLEHLIYMGSKRYPYKDTLDLLANRCLADR